MVVVVEEEEEEEEDAVANIRVSECEHTRGKKRSLSTPAK